MSIKDFNLPKNEEITARNVRVISPDGKQLGIFPTDRAIRMAKDRGLDLVLVSPHSDPPVAKMMDYGKYKYELTKKAKESKQKKNQLKQMKFRPKIDEHDYQTKVKKLKEFLEDGYKVRVTVMFRGREMAFTDRGREILERVAKDLEDVSTLESPPKLEGRDMWMTLRPKVQK